MQNHQKFIFKTIGKIVFGNICNTRSIFLGDSNEHLITNMLKYKNYPKTIK